MTQSLLNNSSSSSAAATPGRRTTPQYARNGTSSILTDPNDSFDAEVASIANSQRGSHYRTPSPRIRHARGGASASAASKRSRSAMKRRSPPSNGVTSQQQQNSAGTRIPKRSHSSMDTSSLDAHSPMISLKSDSLLHNSSESGGAPQEGYISRRDSIMSQPYSSRQHHNDEDRVFYPTTNHQTLLSQQQQQNRKRRQMLSSAPSSQQRSSHHKKYHSPPQNGFSAAADSNKLTKDPQLIQKRMEKKRELETIYNVEANIKRKLVPPSSSSSHSRRRRVHSSHATKVSSGSGSSLPKLAQNNNSKRAHSASASVRRKRTTRPTIQPSPNNEQDNLVLHPSEHEIHHNDFVEDDHKDSLLNRGRNHHLRPRGSIRKLPNQSQEQLHDQQQQNYLSPNHLLPNSTTSARSSLSHAESSTRRKSAFSVFSNASTKKSPIQQNNSINQKKNQLDFLEKNLDLKKRQESQLELAIRLQKRQLQLLRRRMKSHQKKEEKAKAAMERFDAMGGTENVFKKLEEANRLLESKEKRLKSLAADLSEIQKMTEEKQKHLSKLEINLKADINQIESRLNRLKDMEQDFKKKQRSSNIKEMKLKSLEEQLEYKHKLNEEKRREVISLEEDLKRANKLNQDKKSKLQTMERDLLLEKKQLESRQHRLEQDTTEFHEEQKKNEVKQKKQWEQIQDMEKELSERERSIVSMLEIDEQDILTYGSPNAIAHKLKALKDTATRAEQLFMKRSSSAKNRSEEDNSTLNIDDTLGESADVNKSVSEDKSSIQRDLFPNEHKTASSSKGINAVVDWNHQYAQTEVVQILSELSANQAEQDKLAEQLKRLDELEAHQNRRRDSRSSQVSIGSESADKATLAHIVKSNADKSTAPPPRRDSFNKAVGTVNHSAAEVDAETAPILERENKLANQIASFQEQLTALQNNHQSEIEQIKQQITKKASNTQKAKVHIDNETQLSQQLSKLQVQIETTQQEHRSEIENIKALLLSNTKDNLNLPSSSVDGSASTKDILKREHQLSSQAKNLHKKLESLQQEQDSEVQLLRDILLESVDSSDEVVQKSIKKEKDLSHRVKKTQNRLRTIREEYEKELSQILEAVSSAQPVSVTSESLQTQNDSSPSDSKSTALQEQQLQVIHLQEEIDQLKRQHSEELEQLQKRLSTSSDSGAQPTADDEELKKTVKILQEELEEARRVAECTPVDEAAFNKKITELRKELELQKEKNAQLVSQMQESINEEKAMLQEKLDALREESRQLQNQLHEAEFDSRKRLHERLQQERDAMHQREAELHDRHQQTLQEKLDEIARLQTNLTQLRAEFEEQKDELVKQKVETLKSARLEFESRLQQQLQEKALIVKKLRSEQEINLSAMTDTQKDEKVREIESMERALEQEKQLLEKKYGDDIQQRIEAFEKKEQRFQQEHRARAEALSANMEKERLEISEKHQHLSQEINREKQDITDDYKKNTAELHNSWNDLRDQMRATTQEAREAHQNQVEQSKSEKEVSVSKIHQESKSHQEEYQQEKQKLSKLRQNFDAQYEKKKASADGEDDLEQLAQEKRKFDQKMLKLHDELDAKHDQAVEDAQSKLRDVEQAFAEKQSALEQSYDARLKSLNEMKEQELQKLLKKEKSVEETYQQKLEALSTMKQEVEESISAQHAQLMQQHLDFEKEYKDRHEQRQKEFYDDLQTLQNDLQVEQPLEPVLDESVEGVDEHKAESTPAEQEELGEFEKIDESSIPTENTVENKTPEQLTSHQDTGVQISMKDPVLQLGAIISSLESKLAKLGREKTDFYTESKQYLENVAENSPRTDVERQVDISNQASEEVSHNVESTSADKEQATATTAGSQQETKVEDSVDGKEGHITKESKPVASTNADDSNAVSSTVDAADQGDDVSQLKKQLTSLSETHKSDLLSLLSSLRQSQTTLEEYQKEMSQHQEISPPSPEPSQPQTAPSLSGEESETIPPKNQNTAEDAKTQVQPSIPQQEEEEVQQPSPESEQANGEEDSHVSASNSETTELKQAEDDDLSREELLEKIRLLEQEVAETKSKLNKKIEMYDVQSKELAELKETTSQQHIMDELMRVKEQERNLRDQLDEKTRLLEESRSKFDSAHASVSEDAVNKYKKAMEDIAEKGQHFEKTHAEAQKNLEEKVAQLTTVQETLRNDYEGRLQQLEAQLHEESSSKELQSKLEAEKQQVKELQEKIAAYEQEKDQWTKDRELLLQEKEHYAQLKKDLDDKLALVQQISLNLQNVKSDPGKSKDEINKELNQLEENHSARGDDIEKEKQALKANLEEDKSKFEKQQAQDSQLAEEELKQTKESLEKMRQQFEQEHETMKMELQQEYDAKFAELTKEQKRLEELEKTLNDRESASAPSEAMVDNMMRKKLDRLSEDLHKLKKQLAEREAKIVQEETKLKNRVANQNEMMARFEHRMHDEQRELNDALRSLQQREEDLELRYSRLTARLNDVRVDAENNHKPLRRLYTALDSQVTITATTATNNRSMSMGSEKRVVYVSKMVSVADCEAIVKQSVIANREHNITGVLIASDSAFLQIIEGKSREVDRLYRRIIRDRRHQDIHCIRVEDDIQTRLYQSPMRFIRTPANAMFAGGGADTLSIHSGLSPSLKSSPGGGRVSTSPMSKHSGNAPADGLTMDAQAVLHMFDLITSSYRCIEKYVSPLVINMSKSGVNPLILPAVQRERIIMLIDVVKFAIRLRPEEVKSIMAKYFSIARKCVTKYRGDVLQYSGNSIVAVFDQDEAHSAVKASMLLFKTVLAKMPIDTRNRNAPVLQLGILLTQGEILEGSFGCGALMSYHIVGEHLQRAWQIASHMPEQSHLLTFDKSICSGLKKQKSPYDNQVKHVGTVHVNAPRSGHVELYSLSKKPIIVNENPVKKSRRDDMLTRNAI